MLKWKTVWIVLGTLVVIALLSVGGYALYRLGYSRGVQATVAQMGMTEFHHDFMGFMGQFDDRLPPDFSDRFRDRFDRRDFFRPGGVNGSRSDFYSFSPASFFWLIPGALLFFGFIALVVIATVLLTRSKPDQVEEQGSSRTAKK